MQFGAYLRGIETARQGLARRGKARTFGAYLRGIETALPCCSALLGTCKFGAYLRGIETMPHGEASTGNQSSLEPTYEGLKHSDGSYHVEAVARLEPTYEGLKRGVGLGRCDTAPGVFGAYLRGIETTA